jgi:hypothetical protein
MLFDFRLTPVKGMSMCTKELCYAVPRGPEAIFQGELDVSYGA